MIPEAGTETERGRERERGRMERLLGRAAALSERRPRLLLLGIAWITLFFAVQLPRVQISYDPLAFLPRAERVELFRHVEEEFGVGSFSHLVVVRFAPRPGYSLDHPQAIREMEAVLQGLRGVPEVLQARGIPDFVKFVRQELHGGDRRYAVLPPEDGPDELGYTFPDLIRLTFQRMALVQKFLSPQGTALATATLAPEADLIRAARAVQQAVEPVRQSARALQIDVASYGGTLDAFRTITQSDLRVLTPAVGALVVGVLVWIFRLTRRRELLAALSVVLTVGALALGPSLLPLSERGVFLWEAAGLIVLLGVIGGTFRPLANLYLPVLVVAVAGTWTFGALGWLGIPFTFLMVAVVPLLLGVGIDDALHLLHRYEEERCKGHTGPKAMGIALRRTGRALLLTTLTTTAGFAALLLAPSPPLRAFGMLAALAMLSAFTVTVLLVPAVKALSREGPRTERWPPASSPRWLVRAFGHPAESGVSRLLGAYARGTARRGIALGVLLLGLVLGAVGYWEGHAFQTYSVDYRKLLPPDHPVAQLYTEINREFRPYDEVQIVLRGDLARLDVMRVLLQDLPTALAGSPYAHKVTSFAHVLEDVRAANAGLSEGFLERFLEDPDGAYRWLLAEVLAQERLRSRIAPYARAISDPRPPGGFEVEAVVRVNTLRFSDQQGVVRVTRDLTKRLEPVFARLEALGVQAHVTGTPYLEEIGLEALRLSFKQSLFLSFLFCFVVLGAVFGSAKWAALALSPVVLVTGLVLGSLKLLGIELNAATAVVAALSIGLGIDYAIHLLNRFREERDLEVTTARTGEALSAAFVTTSSAFFALLLGQITWNRDFGLLVGLAIVFAFAATVFFLTALLRLTAVSTSTPLPAPNRRPRRPDPSTPSPLPSTAPASKPLRATLSSRKEEDR